MPDVGLLGQTNSLEVHIPHPKLSLVFLNIAVDAIGLLGQKNRLEEHFSDLKLSQVFLI